MHVKYVPCVRALELSMMIECYLLRGFENLHFRAFLYILHVQISVYTPSQVCAVCAWCMYAVCMGVQVW